jgi:hypothetical protein
MTQRKELFRPYHMASYTNYTGQLNSFKGDTWRIVVLGDGGVGKSALVCQVRSVFCPRCPLTDFII